MAIITAAGKRSIYSSPSINIIHHRPLCIMGPFRLIPNHRGRAKKLVMAMPATIAAALVVMFLLFSMSPMMDGVLIKNAAATHNITIDPNNYVSLVALHGKPRSDSPSTDGLASFTIVEDGTTGITTYYTNTLIRTGGTLEYIRCTGGTDDSDYGNYLTSLGYDGANMNYTGFRSVMKLTVTITNPSSVSTSYDVFSYEPVGLNFMPYNNTKMSAELDWMWTADIPDYTFSVAGTYTFAYTWQVYY